MRSNTPITPTLLLAFFLFDHQGEAQTANHPKTATAAYESSGLIQSMDQLDDRTIFHVGDSVSFRVLEDEQPPTILTVSDSGQIQAPYVGNVIVLNKTPRQVAYQVQQALQTSLYKKATVLISLEKKSVQSPGRVFMTGEVNHQGSLELRPNEELTVSQAITEAGGFSDFANKRKVKIIRKSAGASKPVVVDVADIMNKGRTDLDIVLVAGDVVLVPARLINW